MTATLDLTGRVALVTGGSRGIGLATAQALALAGASVVAWGRGATGTPGPVSYDRVDVTDEVAVERGMTAIIARFGRIDVVFACAGISGISRPFVEQSRADWANVFAVNVHGLVSTMRTAVRHMGSGGGLVGFGSLSASKGAVAMQPYAASKAATEAIMRGLAAELGGRGIRANTIVPGWIETDLTAPARIDAGRERILRRTPIGRWGQPSDIASLAVFLASDAARFITGATLVADGGFGIA